MRADPIALGTRGRFDGRRVERTRRAPGHARTTRDWAVSNELLASAAMLSLVGVTLLGSIGVLMFIATSAVLILQHPRSNLLHILRFSPLLALPVLAIVSSQWSIAPAATMRGALQLLLTFIAAIVIARNLRAERLVLVLFVGFFVICVAVLPGVPNALSTGLPLSSPILGSKNQVAFAGFMLATLAIALVIDRSQPVVARLAAVASLPMAVGLLYLARSGGGTSSLLIGAVVVPALAAFGVFKLGARVGILLFVLGLVALALVFLQDIEAALVTFRTQTLQKDATLTGRTYLWDFAARLSQARPWLGLGYGAFWQQGNIDAEGLWRWAGIVNRSGFNFHNAFVGIKVDLGLVGEALLILMCALVAIAGFARQLVRPTPAMACLLGLLIVAYARSFVEDGLVAPFSLVTVTWIATFVYGMAQSSERRATGLFVRRSRRV